MKSKFHFIHFYKKVSFHFSYSLLPSLSLSLSLSPDMLVILCCEQLIKSFSQIFSLSESARHKEVMTTLLSWKIAIITTTMKMKELEGAFIKEKKSAFFFVLVD